MKKHFSFLLSFASVFVFMASVVFASVDNFRINQIGYLPNAPKVFIYVGEEAVNTFSILEYYSGNTVMQGTLNAVGVWDQSGENVRQGFFSGLQAEGSYVIRVGQETSHVFQIKDSLYKDVFRASLRSFFHQRASMAIEEPYAEGFAREKGHPDTSLLFFRARNSTETPAQVDRTVTWSSPGGWYDAGDYGKYMVNGGIAVATMMQFHELYPEYVTDGLSNIPESGNGVSDLLDELRYQLEWMLTMQDPEDGASFFKVAGLQWPGGIMPHQDRMQRYVIGKSTSSTLNLVASMAQASRIFAEIDPAFAQRCLEAAKFGYQWVLANPDVFPPNPNVDNSWNTGSGAYGDTRLNDEFLWAVAELFITTQDSIYLDTLSQIMSANISGPAGWNQMQNLAFFSIAAHRDMFPQEISQPVVNAIIAYSDRIVEHVNTSHYRTPMGMRFDFYWGSNSVLLNYLIIAAYAYELTGELKYLNAISESMDYIFGKNATSYSFVTGFGSKASDAVHHRPSYGFPGSIIGFLAGGPNRDAPRQDGQRYPSEYPARVYADITGSFATNEVAINWNSPLTFMLGFLNIHAATIEPTTGVVETTASDVKSLGLEIFPNPFNPVANISFSIPASQKSASIAIYNISGQKVYTREISGVNMGSFQWAPHSNASGVYFIRINAGNLNKTRRAVFLK